MDSLSFALTKKVVRGRSDRHKIIPSRYSCGFKLDDVHWANPPITVQSVPELPQLNIGDSSSIKV